MKNTLVIVSGVVTVGCLAAAVLLGQTASKARKELDEERYSRMVAEEKIEKVNQKIRTLESQLDNTQIKSNDTRSVLEQEKKTSAQLKAELEKMTKLKEVLEEELKKALVQASQSAPQPVVSEPQPASVTPPSGQ